MAELVDASQVLSAYRSGGNARVPFETRKLQDRLWEVGLKVEVSSLPSLVVYGKEETYLWCNMTIDKLKPGMTVYDVQRYRMGNTNLRSVGVYDVRIIEIQQATSNYAVLASWNHNSPRLYYHKQWSKWRLKKPKTVTMFTGQVRLSRKGE